MTKYFKAEHEGRVQTRSSDSKTYTHCNFSLGTWASRLDLAQKAAAPGNIIVPAVEISAPVYRAILKAAKEAK